MQIYEKMRAESRRILSYNMRHFGTLEGWLRELNLDYAPIEVKEVRPIACYNAVRFDVVCHGVTLASFMKMNSGYPKYPYILTHLNRAVPQFERDWETGKLRKVGVCTTQILDFYWGGGIGKILSDKPTVKDLAPLRKRMLEGIDRFRRTLDMSIVACRLRDKEHQFTPIEWDWIKSAHRNPKYALRRISSLRPHPFKIKYVPSVDIRTLAEFIEQEYPNIMKEYQEELKRITKLSYESLPGEITSFKQGENDAGNNLG